MFRIIFRNYEIIVRPNLSFKGLHHKKTKFLNPINIVGTTKNELNFFIR